MIDNSKEYILCAAYLFKDGYITPEMADINQELAEKANNLDGDIKNLYKEPHRQVFNMATGWRHADILYKYGDCIKKDMGGFMTSKGRYVNREEAAQIALECGQITDPDIRILYSEDIY